MASVAEHHRMMLKKRRPNTKHDKVYIELHRKFTFARAKGLKVSINQLMVIGRRMHGRTLISMWNGSKALSVQLLGI